MEVLLIEDFPALGYVGDTVQVRNGYARNFLFPRGIAVDFASRKAKEFNHIMAGITAKRSRLRGEAEELGKKVSAERLSFELKVGAGGKAFGSVGTRDILKALQDRGYAIDKKQVRLNDIIKSAGEFEAEIQLHSEVVVPVTVDVKAIAEKVAKPEGKKSRKKEASDEDQIEGEESSGVVEEEQLLADSESGEELDAGFIAEEEASEEE